MLPKRLIERYLVFLLRRRVPISIAIAVGRIRFAALAHATYERLSEQLTCF